MSAQRSARGNHHLAKLFSKIVFHWRHSITDLWRTGGGIRETAGLLFQGPSSNGPAGTAASPTSWHFHWSVSPGRRVVGEWLYPLYGRGLCSAGAGAGGGVGGGVAAAAILDSAVAVAAVGYRVWGVALPSPFPQFGGGGSSPWGGGATAVASAAMAATAANPGE